MSRNHVFIVDDEPNILELVKFNLEREGYRVTTAENGREALDRINASPPDLVILDIMLPGMDGLEVCRNMQNEERTRGIPIIMLTARAEEMDKVLGLELGADDYLTKPFSPRELVARVKARLRRLAGEETKRENVIQIGEITIDSDKFCVYAGGAKQDFTPKEFELLKVLAQNPGRVITREHLLEKIWGYDYIGDTRTVDVHIRHIRQKLEENAGLPKYIETIRGIGYKIREDI